MLDKTGTITLGQPEVTHVLVVPGEQEDAVLRLTAEAEQGSEHALAQAVLKAARRRRLTLSARPAQYTALPGQGLRAQIDGQDVLIGTPHLFEDAGCSFEPLREQMEACERQGKSVMLVALDGTLKGGVAVADRVRDEAKSALAQLQALGLEVWMVTGDNQSTAQTIAAQVGISRGTGAGGDAPGGQSAGSQTVAVPWPGIYGGVCGRWDQ